MLLTSRKKPESNLVDVKEKDQRETNSWLKIL